MVDPISAQPVFAGLKIYFAYASIASVNDSSHPDTGAIAFPPEALAGKLSYRTESLPSDLSSTQSSRAPSCQTFALARTTGTSLHCSSRH